MVIWTIPMNQRQSSTYYYQFHTSAGTVRLIPEPGGRYKVKLNDQNHGSYNNAEAAAEGASRKMTFWAGDGNELTDLGIPAELNQWEKRKFTSPATGSDHPPGLEISQ